MGSQGGPRDPWALGDPLAPLEALGGPWGPMGPSGGPGGTMGTHGDPWAPPGDPWGAHGPPRIFLLAPPRGGPILNFG